LGKKSFKTRFIRHSVNPHWNEVMFFNISDDMLRYPVKFSIYDHDKITRNDFVGSVEIPLQSILSKFVDYGGSIDGLGDVNYMISSDLVLDQSPESSISLKFGFKPYRRLRQLYFKNVIDQFGLADDVTFSRLELEAVLEVLYFENYFEIVDYILAKCESSCISRNDIISEIECLLTPHSNTTLRLTSCPYCKVRFQSNSRKITTTMSTIDIITHISLCTNGIQKIDTFLTGGYITESHAQKKWYTKVADLVKFGRYIPGKSNGNILVYERDTGRMIEEKIPDYIRLGIRLLYSRSSKNGEYH
jgi:phosphatidylserine decarboxylase